ncbi:MAG: S9 family peptidase, partial [Anaerolineales bacterium]|nr:S9 family peptidase [Anaerolineales bacterium]
PRYENLHRRGERYFFTRHDGLQNQPKVYLQFGQQGKPRELLDPNSFSEDGTVALMSQHYNKDGRLLAYATAASGSDWQEIRIYNTDTEIWYEEVLGNCKFPGIAWLPDSRGFFYNRLSDPGQAQSDRELRSLVCWHQLGTPQSADAVVFQYPEDEGLRFYPSMTEDDQYLWLYANRGTDRRNGIFIRPVPGEQDFWLLIEPGLAKFWPAGNQGSLFYFLTDLEAENGRLIAIDLQQPERAHWQEIIPAGPDALASAVLWGGQLVVVSSHDAYHRIQIYDLDGQLQGEVPLPAMGTINLVEGSQDNPEIFFSFESFLYPATIFRYDLQSKELAPFGEVPLDFDFQAYETSQAFYPSKDGTRVPMFLTHRKGLELNGDNPTILYGYGGFTLSQTPFFSVWNLVWLELGGVFALANLRGGLEYGEAWHQAGMLANKQNVFDDFIAAAEWLIETGYTRTEKLAIEGRSNGGLLTSACMVQRPDLYGAVLCWVPVTDMLRFHKFTVGHFWTGEYGNAEESRAHFDFLYAYSPVHNVQTRAYPPIIVTTGDTDDRVVPAHSKKFVAELQAKNTSPHPMLLRIDLKAGHKLGKPTYKLIEEHSDVLAFTVRALGMEQD